MSLAVDDHKLGGPLAGSPRGPKVTSGEDDSKRAVSKSARESQKEKVSPWLHFVAGGFGGMAGAVFTSPFDVVKTRLQSDQYASFRTSAHLAHSRNPLVAGYGHVRDTFSIIRGIYRVEGFPSLFKGLGPNLVGVIPARSINFFTYGLCKDVYSRNFNNGHESTRIHLASAVTAGIVTSTATNPIWLVKTRLQLDKASKGERMYKNSVDCVKKVMRTEGIRGLYAGLSASYLGTVESSLQWVLYEQMKSFIRRREQARIDRGAVQTRWDDFLNWSATSGSAGMAKLVASLITYPHEVARTRLRQAPLEHGRPKYTGIIQTFRLIIKEEGLAYMYGGLTPHLLRTVPNSIIMFGTWELIIRLVSAQKV